MAILARLVRALFGRSETRRAILDLHDAHARLAAQTVDIEVKLRDLAAEATVIERRIVTLETRSYDLVRRLDDAGVPEHFEPITIDLTFDLLVEDPVVFDPED